MRKPTLLLFLALAALLFGAWRYSATRPFEAELAVVARGTARSMVEEEGRTRVAERYVVASPVAGRILRIERREGDAVARGDLLAEVDPLALRARVGEAEARVRALREQEAGVPERRPKPEELERARVLAERAAVAAEAAAREAAEAVVLAEQAARDAARARALREAGTLGVEEMEKTGTAAEQALLRREAQEAMRQVAALDARAAALEAALLAARGGDFVHEERRLREEAAASRRSSRRCGTISAAPASSPPPRVGCCAGSRRASGACPRGSRFSRSGTRLDWRWRRTSFPRTSPSCAKG